MVLGCTASGCILNTERRENNFGRPERWISDHSDLPPLLLMEGLFPSVILNILKKAPHARMRPLMTCATHCLRLVNLLNKVRKISTGYGENVRACGLGADGGSDSTCDSGTWSAVPLGAARFQIFPHLIQEDSRRRKQWVAQVISAHSRGVELSSELFRITARKQTLHQSRVAIRVIRNPSFRSPEMFSRRLSI